MKIVTVIGSPRGMKGSTGSLLAEVIRSAQKAGAKVQTFSLVDYPVKPCRACDVCHKTGKCSIDDGLSQILPAMMAADGIVLASPNYIFSVSAQLKALLDRCCGPLHCQAMEGKYAAAVVTSGGAGGEAVEAYMLRFLQALGCWTVGSVGGSAMDLADEKSRQGRFWAAAELGSQLCQAIAAKKNYPDQAQDRVEFYQRMKQLMEFRKDDWPYEYNYWAQRGRLG